ncbi:hypothetical protein OG552_17490 [Streptomyces sp. NBC_01476]|uniref:hypothetical protein n=1 Tax=Streptomyces sp. NBC_01476 TaxID=2903881 RepID=UPI002E32AD26|nr:hypothetical protein [Streptomyces sp. NBC_01476]
MTAWHVTLTAGVHALATTARELRAAHQHATHALWTTDPTRVTPAPGIVMSAAGPVRPHEHTLRQLTTLYTRLEQQIRELYEAATLAYAYGTAHTLTAVLRNERPRHAPASPDPVLPDLSQSLTVRAGARDLAALRGRLLTARDNESPDLADTACAYGERAERTLHHLLDLAKTNGFLTKAS